jgi:hydrogenase maturation protease
MDLVVGIGNELRSDDGVGIRVVASLPPRLGVETAVVQQLTPDLVDLLGRAERVLFVDAHATERCLRLARLSEGGAPPAVGHVLEPEILLAWTRVACGRAPEGWALTVPAQSFAMGEGLSPETERAVPGARRAALDWLDRRAVAHEEN